MPVEQEKNKKEKLQRGLGYKPKANLTPQGLGQLASEFAQVLKLESSSCDTLPMLASFPRNGEPEMNSLELLSHDLKTKAQKEDLEPFFSSEPSPEQGLRSVKSELPSNFHCESCAMRLYPVKKFFRSGKLPLLFLHYNGLLSRYRRQVLPRDRSSSLIFGSQAEDELFARLLGKLGFQENDFNYQEYPACHFDPSSSREENWKERAQNCLEHVERSVKENKIQKIVLCGNAAVALLGLEEAQEKAKSMDIFPFPSFWAKAKEEKIDCIVLRSPKALLSLEEQRRESKEAKKRAALLAQEKEIKSKILASLQNFLSSFAC